MSSPLIVAFAGSYRPQSLNRRLLSAAVALAEKAGARVDVVDLAALADAGLFEGCGPALGGEGGRVAARARL